mmetsp:Transcript_31202/g.72749  ORF Transcript_31202/g.72749 Transcript_31202/m.72749 type:complete len:237 (-) Transcript_31202:16-726(-)
MPAVVVEVSPFIKPCPEAEKRMLHCQDGAIVADALKVIGDALGTDPQTLSLVRHASLGPTVVLLPSDTVPPRVHLRGLKSVQKLPNGLEVRTKSFRTTMTKGEALKIQDDTIELYENELLQLQLQQLQRQIAPQWVEKGKITYTDYMNRLQDVLAPYQRTLLERWNFEPGKRGLFTMQSIFTSKFSVDPDVQENVEIINALVGTDLNWNLQNLDPRVVEGFAGLAKPQQVDTSGSN